MPAAEFFSQHCGNNRRIRTCRPGSPRRRPAATARPGRSSSATIRCRPCTAASAITRARTPATAPTSTRRSASMPSSGSSATWRSSSGGRSARRAAIGQARARRRRRTERPLRRLAPGAARAHVVIYEAGPMAGGMMHFGIPKYRLPREVLDGEIARIVSLGVEIVLNHKVDDLGREGRRALRCRVPRRRRAPQQASGHSRARRRQGSTTRCSS